MVVLGLPLAILLAFWFAFLGRVYPRVNVCQIVLTGKNQKEARLALTNILTKKAPLKITLRYQEENFPLDLTSLEYLSNDSSQKALNIGRDNSLFQNLKQVVVVSWWGKDLFFDFQLDNTQIESEIASIAAKLYQPAVNPTIKITQKGGLKTVSVDDGKNGQEINLRELKQDILASLSCPKREIVLSIPLVTVTSQISPDMAEETRKRASLFLGKTISLQLEDQEWTVDDEEIISFISFYGGFDQHKIAEYSQNLAKTINTLPENAAFRFENNRVTLFRPSKDGLSLEEDQFAEEFEKALVVLEATQQNQTMSVPVKKTAAQISIANINSLGIQELLGRGSSLFFGSISERIHNINLASLRLNGILVAPEETFSFNKTLGDVSADTGFKQAYIIKEGRTILGDGGGVCQVSTTLFRAALNTGLPITERQAHAYRVHYYEDDLGPGFDATVFDPTADLKMKNDTPAFILIQSNIDLKKKKLTFEIYGTNDGRKVEISKARVWDKVPPLPDLYQDDPTLPMGTIKQVDWKAWGAKAAFDYKVTRNGETIFEKTFFSTYKPWQAVYLRGTGR